MIFHASAAIMATAPFSASISASGRRPAALSSSAAASKSSAAAAGLKSGKPSSEVRSTSLGIFFNNKIVFFLPVRVYKMFGNVILEDDTQRLRKNGGWYEKLIDSITQALLIMFLERMQHSPATRNL